MRIRCFLRCSPTALVASAAVLAASYGCSDDAAGTPTDGGRDAPPDAPHDSGMPPEDAAGDPADGAAPDGAAPDGAAPDGGMTCSSPGRVRDIAAASDHSCAVRSDGMLFCWGANDHGQIGLGAEADDVLRTPMAVPEGDDWTAVSAGVDYTCGLRGGTLWCWGHNMYGRLGVEDTMQRPSPTQVGEASDWTLVRAGPFHACGLRGEGQLWCWGHNAGGRLGVGDAEDRHEPTPVNDGTWRHVAPGGSHTCAIDDEGGLWCWGGNSNGQLGLTDSGTGTERDVPTPVGDATNWVDVSTGASHSCGVRADESLWCWGSNGVDQLGLGPDGPAQAEQPVRVHDEAAWASVTATALQTCARRTDGRLWCWGSNGSGQLGVGDKERREEPAAVEAARALQLARGGSRHTCAVDDDEAPWCWGSNADGQLGLGEVEERLVPTPVCLPAAE